MPNAHVQRRGKSRPVCEKPPRRGRSRNRPRALGSRQLGHTFFLRHLWPRLQLCVPTCAARKRDGAFAEMPKDFDQIGLRSPPLAARADKNSNSSRQLQHTVRNAAGSRPLWTPRTPLRTPPKTPEECRANPCHPHSPSGRRRNENCTYFPQALLLQTLKVRPAPLRLLNL